MKTRTYIGISGLSLSILLLLVMFGALPADAYPGCGTQMGCNIDIDCEWYGGSTCLNVGGFQSCNLCQQGQFYQQGTNKCGKKFYGALGYCIAPGAGCGGPQCLIDAFHC